MLSNCFVTVSGIEDESNNKPYLFSKHIFDDEFFCWVMLVILMPAKVFCFCYIFCQFFLKILFISRWISFLASLYISQSMLRRLNLNFLNNLSLSLVFRYFPIKPSTACIFYSYSFQGSNFLYQFNKLMKKVVLCLVHIIFFIVRKYHLTQSFSYSSTEYFLNDLKEICL